MELEENHRRTEEFLASFRPAAMPAEMQRRMEAAVRGITVRSGSPSTYSKYWKLGSWAAVLAVLLAGFILYRALRKTEPEVATPEIVTVPAEEQSPQKLVPQQAMAAQDLSPVIIAPREKPKTRNSDERIEALALAFEEAQKIAASGSWREALERGEKAVARENTHDPERCRRLLGQLQLDCEAALQRELSTARRALSEDREAAVAAAVERLEGSGWPAAIQAAAGLREGLAQRHAHRQEEQTYAGLFHAVAAARAGLSYDDVAAKIQASMSRIQNAERREELTRLMRELLAAGQVRLQARRALQACLGQNVSFTQKDGTNLAGKLVRFENDRLEIEVAKGATLTLALQALAPMEQITLARQAPNSPKLAPAGLALFLMDNGAPGKAVNLLQGAGVGEPVSQALAQGLAAAKEEARRRWCNSIHGEVRNLDGERVSVGYDFRDPRQLEDWSMVGSPWRIEGGQLLAEKGNGELRLPLTDDVSVHLTLLIEADALAQASQIPEWLRESVRVLQGKEVATEHLPTRNPIGVMSAAEEPPVSSPLERRPGFSSKRPLQAELVLFLEKGGMRAMYDQKVGERKEIYRGPAFRKGIVLMLGGGVKVLKLEVEGKADLESFWK